MAGCRYSDPQSTLCAFIEARHHMANALLKGGSEDLCRTCLSSILKSQKAYMVARNPTQLIKQAIHVVSSGLSEEERGISETTTLDIEGLIECLRKEALQRNKDYNARLVRLKCDSVSTEETSDEESVTESDDKACLEYMLSHFSRRKDGSEEAERDDCDSGAQKMFMEVHNPASSEKTLREVCSSSLNEEAQKTSMEAHDPASSDKTVVDVSYSSLNKEAQTTFMEAHKPASNAEAVYEVLPFSSDEDDGGFLELGSIVPIMRGQQEACLSDIEMFRKYNKREEDIQKADDDVFKPAAIEVAWDEKQDCLEIATTELKHTIQFVILEQIRRSAEATHTRGDGSNADNLTKWGSALLGLSIRKSCDDDAKAKLISAVSILEGALRLDGSKTDALCYASCACAALFWLTYGYSESNKYFDKAMQYIEDAMGQDSAELFKECKTLILELKEQADKDSKKRKHGDAFLDLIDC